MAAEPLHAESIESSRRRGGSLCRGVCAVYDEGREMFKAIPGRVSGPSPIYPVLPVLFGLLGDLGIATDSIRISSASATVPFVLTPDPSAKIQWAVAGGTASVGGADATA